MREFTNTIKSVFTGSMQSFKDFPATILCGFGYLLVTIVGIQMDLIIRDEYSFLFNCLQLSFALGASFSLMGITFAHSRFNTKKVFLLANVAGLVSVVFTFVMLYFFSHYTPYSYGQYQAISPLAIARVSVGIVVTYLIFIVLSGNAYDNDETYVNRIGIFNIDFPKSLFMSTKAFFISLIYGIVIMTGASGIAGAIQSLLYQEMTNKVYMYIGAITGFIVFTIFIGYFPNFRRGVNDPQREVVETQPRFIEILLGYIMVPLIIALTLVLLLWTGRQIITGVDVTFEQLSSIASAYTIGGIWLHMMVSRHDTKLSKIFRRFYPITAIIILVFEARALIKQVAKSGLKLTEYWFILVWIGALAGAILLIVLKSKAYILIVTIVCLLAIFSVFPYVGYNALPVRAQVNRLEKLLINENMLQGDTIIVASEEPKYEVKVAITDAYNYLAYASDAKTPSWFDERISDYDSFSDNYYFKEVFGFDKTWPRDDNVEQFNEYKSISLYLPSTAIDVKDYDLAINIASQPKFESEPNFVKVEGGQGTYHIYWNPLYTSEIPSIEIRLNDETIIKEDMREYIDSVKLKYSYDSVQFKPANLEDLSVVLESEEVEVLLVFASVDFNEDTQRDNNYYMIELDAIYMNEKK